MTARIEPSWIPPVPPAKERRRVASATTTPSSPPLPLSGWEAWCASVPAPSQADLAAGAAWERETRADGAFLAACPPRRPGRMPPPVDGAWVKT